MFLSSLSNPRLQHIQKLLTSTRYRRDCQECVLESIRPIREWLSETQSEVVCLVINADADADSLALPDINGLTVYQVPGPVFQRLTTLKESPGALLVIKRPVWNALTILPLAKTVLLLDHIQNPANLGAICRNAAGFAVDAILITEGCADPGHPEALRAMAGNLRQIPILRCDAEAQNLLIQHQFTTWFFSPEAQTAFTELPVPERICLVLGSEGNGIQADPLLTNLPGNALSIPMSAKIESLNVAVSSGIVLFYIYMARNLSA